MEYELKPLSDQVIVITGASSGIGFATARLAAKKGARVVLVSRSKRGLQRAARAIRKAGGEASYVAADVAEPAEVQDVVDETVRAFGGFDTWINNAGVSIYGETWDIPLEDARRLFDTNYWGVVNGSLAALPVLRERGGALINVGSALSDRAIPLQGHYSASKHAVKGFTDALRMELERDGAPISLTLIKPGAIDTPYPRHARNLMEVEPTNPPPLYTPRVVAKAILRAARRPVREVTVGAGGRMISALGSLAPKLADRYMRSRLFEQQRTGEPASADRPDALYKARRGEERGDHEGHVRRTSLYTHAASHPLQTVAVLALLGVGVAVALGDRETR